MQKKKTSWGHVSGWYDELIERGEDTYQKKVILPNLLRLMEVKKGETVLDLACGQGFFSRELEKQGAQVIGVDISKELIALARAHSPKSIRFEVSSVDDLSFLQNNSFDAAVIVLAIQNIENIDGMLKECSRVLKQNGRFFIVMNHPVFRVPKESSWGWDEKLKIQYRRVDKYLSEVVAKIVMNPGARTSVHTISFHRSLQFYFKKFSKNGFAVTRLEEWISHRKSEKGPRAIAEDHARKEIPLFLCLEIKKL
ncbi:MAG: class I SAM-dependent methyltransferase [Candidatus Yonathbacteria bacterium]|nr:class I SAM-dependent methyltransferase [Candidatus Yonathbacteria bacterium]